MNSEDKQWLLKDFQKKKYPKAVFFIIGNEFCERFSYYGMRTILSLYLVDILKYSEGDATLIYHAYTMLCYFFPLAGAIIADSYLGKYRTIFYLSVVYAVGNLVISSASTPFFTFENQRLLSLVGLLLISVGTGGIKPCVSAFGGDQFVLPQQAKQLAQFFSIFYFSINAGSLFSTSLTPILRHDVKCFGDNSCFSLAFGVPAFLMVTSLFIFVAGKYLYVCKEPEGNVIVDVSKCVTHAFIMKLKTNAKKEHWLDYAADKYDTTLIASIKAVLGILFLYLPLPLFWALFDQQGSRWTFQATRMDGSLGWFTIKPDQMQVVNPLLILTFIPLFETVVYPCFAKCNILVKPLQRLCVGGLLAAAAFFVSALVEVKLEATYPVLPQAGLAQLRIFNGLPCGVEVMSPLTSVTGHVNSLSVLQATEIPLSGSADFELKFTVDSNCSQFSEKSFVGKASLQEAQAVTMFLTSSSGTLKASQIPGFDSIEKPVDGYPKLRLLYNLKPSEGYVNLIQDNYNQNISLSKDSTFTDLITISKTGRFDAVVADTQVLSDIELGPAGVYTLVLTNTNATVVGRLLTVTPPNSVHMLWLLPQYIIMTAGEVMFSITGLQFSFTQAPESMKSLISAAWLLTVSFGNLIVVVVSEITFKSQVWEFLLFAVLMVIDMIIFAIFAYRYKNYIPDNPETKEDNS